MAEQISIWRWALTDDLEARFAQLVADPELAFAALNLELAGRENVQSLNDVEAETVAKFRAMDLPEDILQTMLDGFKTMMEEAREDEVADTVDDEFAPSQVGRNAVALASSHLFHEKPFASLAYEEIDRQVGALVAAYRGAISKAVGHAGQDFSRYLGLDAGGFEDDDVFDILLKNGVESCVWVWSLQDAVFLLIQRQEDKELPIDLEFQRAPFALFAALKARVSL